jgi:hypothetical protein
MADSKVRAARPACRQPTFNAKAKDGIRKAGNGHFANRRHNWRLPTRSLLGANKRIVALGRFDRKRIAHYRQFLAGSICTTIGVILCNDSSAPGSKHSSMMNVIEVQNNRRDRYRLQHLCVGWRSSFEVIAGAFNTHPRSLGPTCRSGLRIDSHVRLVRQI